MKKIIILLLAFITGTVPSVSASSLRFRVEKSVVASCHTRQEFDEAVQKRDFRRLENTLLNTRDKASLQQWLRRGVLAQGRTVSVPEYFIATAKAGETDRLKEFLSVYANLYDGDKKGLADNLLEKLALRHQVERKMELVQTIFTSFGLEKISNRTFLYIISEATDESGYQYARFAANKRGSSIFTGRRDAENYPMPYSLDGSEEVCSVLAARLSGNITDSQYNWLKRTKELFCPRKLKPWE